jgi:hypothetical protein
MHDNESHSLPDGAAGGVGAVLQGIAELSALPLWAEVLVAVRMLQRAALAMLEDAPATLRDEVNRACDAMLDCVHEGGLVHRHRALFDRVMTLRDAAAMADTAALRNALWSALDATRAADAAQDFPVDATVARSALNTVRALAADARIGALQLTILLTSDIDQLRFACDTANVARYAALPDDVFQRLTPVHALTLSEPRSQEPPWR